MPPRRRDRSGDSPPTKRRAAASASTGPSPPVEWNILHDSVLVGRLRDAPFAPSTDKIAFFDFDGTLAGVNGNHVFPKNGDDWRFLMPSVPSVLRSLAACGYAIVVISNQKGALADPSASKRPPAALHFRGRVQNLVRALVMHCSASNTASDDPSTTKPAAIFGSSQPSANTSMPKMLFLAAATDDFFRKPRPGLFHLFESELNNTVTVDRLNSFYVGDAAGRSVADWGTKDHSDADIKFAANIGVQFVVPDLLFHPNSAQALASITDPGNVMNHIKQLPHITGINKPLPSFDFNPRTFIESDMSDIQSTRSAAIARLEESLASGDPHLIICVGAPASGKTNFVKQHILRILKDRNPVHVNQDTLKTKSKCLKATSDALSAGLTAIIDNTNPDASVRKQYLDLVQSIDASSSTYGRVRTIAIHFDSPRHIVLHNNSYRALKPQAIQLLGPTWNRTFSSIDHTTHRSNTSDTILDTLTQLQSIDTRSRVPDLVFHTFWKSFDPPSPKEPFDQIISIPFHPDFEYSIDESLWKLFHV